jgi:hypothetical protein
MQKMPEATWIMLLLDIVNNQNTNKAGTYLKLRILKFPFKKEKSPNYSLQI